MATEFICEKNGMKFYANKEKGIVIAQYYGRKHENKLTWDAFEFYKIDRVLGLDTLWLPKELRLNDYYIGKAKCNPDFDKFDLQYGMKLAASRARKAYWTAMTKKGTLLLDRLIKAADSIRDNALLACERIEKAQNFIDSCCDFDE